MTAAAPIVARPMLAGWKLHIAALSGAVAAILLLFRADLFGMIRIWLESSTFNHCALIPPLVGWLVWQRLPELRRLEPAAWPLGLLVVGAGAFGWLLGDAGGVALARHAGLVLMLEGAAIACLGKAVARGLAFPLFYALFMIPAGEELVPPMQRLTAEIAMALLGLTGVPAHIEGVFISIPNGYFEVAEACAGVKFLIAMVALGALVANVCFRSWRRRAAFMAAAVIVPILANGVRAWATIYVAHLTSAAAASGFDHVVYGWFFFALVIALTLALGWRFFDRRPSDPWFDPATLQPIRPRRSHPIPVALAAAAISALPVGWSAAVASVAAPPPADFRLPEVTGWQRVPRGAGLAWEPHFEGADLIRIGHYRDPAGHVVDLAIAVFARQQEGKELVGFGQGAAGPDSGWAWTGDGGPPPSGRSDLIASHGTLREAVSFYRVGGIVTGSPAKAKLETMKVRLLDGPQRAVAVLVSAEAPADGVSPRPPIDAFLSSLGPIAPLADRAAGLH